MGDLLAVGSLFAALLLGASGSTLPPPTPDPGPSDSPLKEIVRVHATTELCRSLLVDAGDAVTVETSNDRRFDTILTSMRTLDFDSSELAKMKSTIVLTNEFATLRASALEGIGTMKQYRAAALTVSDPAQKKALTNFGNALSGALYRQKVLADDLGRFVAFLDTHDAVDSEQDQRMEVNAAIAPHARQNFGQDPMANLPAKLSTLAKLGADDLADRSRRLGDDENRASALIDPAFSGC